MPITDYDDLMDTPASTPVQAIAYRVIGTAVTVDDIRDRLIAHNFDQLSDGDDAAVERAIGAAEIHAGSIMARLGRPLDRDAEVDREVLVLLSVYEMHLRVGSEASGREYRVKAKDLIIAAYGNYPEAGKAEAAPTAAGAVARPARKRYPS